MANSAKAEECFQLSFDSQLHNRKITQFCTIV